MASYKKLDSFDSFFFRGEGGVSISSSSEDNVASAILFTQGFSVLVGGAPHEKGKALGTRLRLPNPVLVINYHVHMIPIQRVKI